MRISDWSSDVCSSDLPFTCRVNPGVLMLNHITKAMHRVAKGSAQQTIARTISLREKSHHLITPARRAFSMLAVAPMAVQLGSESCRVGGCQYVSISVVDVSFKIKKYTVLLLYR